LPVSQAKISCREASPPSIAANSSRLRLRASLMIRIESGLKLFGMFWLSKSLKSTTDYHNNMRLSRNICMVK